MFLSIVDLLVKRVNFKNILTVMIFTISLVTFLNIFHKVPKLIKFIVKRYFNEDSYIYIPKKDIANIIFQYTRIKRI